MISHAYSEIKMQPSKQSKQYIMLPRKPYGTRRNQNKVSTLHDEEPLMQQT